MNAIPGSGEFAPPPSFYVGIYAKGRGRVGIGREQTRLQTLEEGPPATTYCSHYPAPGRTNNQPTE